MSFTATNNDENYLSQGNIFFSVPSWNRLIDTLLKKALMQNTKLTSASGKLKINNIVEYEKIQGVEYFLGYTLCPATCSTNCGLQMTKLSTLSFTGRKNSNRTIRTHESE
ncbi:hypothetical protein Trydic_g13042 [Trypoxylus dichotomus]